MAENEQKPTGKKLTPKQVAFVKNFVKGMSITDAALAAGYSEKNPGQSGYQVLEQVRMKAPELLERHGLSEDKLIEKYLKPALEAEQTEFAKFEGKITDSVDVVAWTPRLAALDMAFNLHGSYAAKKVEGKGFGQTMIQINTMIPRPE